MIVRGREKMAIRCGKGKRRLGGGERKEGKGGGIGIGLKGGT